MFNHYTIRPLLHALNSSKFKKAVFWEHFLRFSTIFLLETSMWNITLYVLNTLFTIKIISSNKSYWMYYSLWSLTFMVPMPIFSGQGGTVFSTHPIYILDKLNTIPHLIHVKIPIFREIWIAVHPSISIKVGLKSIEKLFWCLDPVLFLTHSNQILLSKRQPDYHTLLFQHNLYKHCLCTFYKGYSI